MTKHRVLITTVPFAEKDKLPILLLENEQIEYVINPYNQKLTSAQLAELIPGFDAIIAGTENINNEVLAKADRLKFISRVGIGLDNVDLLYAKEKNIKVSYTADAPAPAVAELTVGLMLSLLRFTQLSNIQMHQGKWHRYFGRRFSEVTIGIIGAGRIGSKVIKHILAFNPVKILVNEPIPSMDLKNNTEVEWVSKEEIYKNADVISLHLPLNSETRGMISKVELQKMKSDALLINTSRGGIINENDLFEIMQSGHLGGAAIDVFQQEPYNGPLQKIDRCILTAHMGSMSIDCRSKMEIEATEEVVRFFKNEPLNSQVPYSEYEALLKSIC
jgi:D-3-phosphoglycerate dehydrogenase